MDTVFQLRLKTGCRTTLLGLIVISCLFRPARRPLLFQKSVLIKVVLLLALLVSFNAYAQQPAFRAVLIGINDYKSPSIKDLNGTGNDVEQMRSLLVNRFGFPSENVTVLQNQAATHTAILSAIRDKLAAPSQPGDVVVFYFSGHGSQMPDVSGDEPDKWDETLVPYDSRMPGIYDISDDELNAAFAEVAARTQNLTIMLDSCNSGTGARSVATPRNIEADTRQPPAGIAASPAASSTEGNDDLMALGRNYVLISGSRADQLSNEDRFDGSIQGALTYHFVQAAKSNTGSTYRSLFPQVVSQVKARFPYQDPQIEGTGLDAQIFGLAKMPDASWLRVERESDGRGKVLAGSLYGVHEGTVLTVYADASVSEPVTKLGILTIDRSEPDSAQGQWRGALPLPTSARARMDKFSFDGRARSIWISPQIPETLRRQLAGELGDYRSLKLLAPVAETEADMRVFTQGNRYAILARDGAVLTSTVKIDEPEVSKRLARQMHDWARWYSLDALQNPASELALSLRVRPVGAPENVPNPISVPDGTPIRVEVLNRSNERLYYALLNLSANGLVKLLHPAPGAQESIAPGGRLVRTYRLAMPDGQAAVTDVFKVIASTSPVAGELYVQDAIRATFNESTPLSKLLMSSATATPREAMTVETKDWTTVQVSMQVTRGTALLRSPRIALHFSSQRDPAMVVGQLSTGSKSICPGDGGADCATAIPLSEDGTILEVTAPTLAGQRDFGGGARGPSIGQAFEDAYRAGESAGADYAEPLVTYQMPGDEDSRTRGGDAPPDSIASSDERWSLKYAGVPGAWDRIRQVTGNPEGREATGVVIAHPDTGYTEHPENWLGATPRALDTDHDHDYYDGDDDAADPLLKDGVIANPGHGTGSGSVIVSPPGCQLTGTTQCVTGTAPGAQLVPLRVHTSVVVFDTGNLARAIEDGASGRWGRKADIVSIAMGGPPSRTLHKAVRSATARGTLVVSAAGNYVRTVVWPARFKETIAVSAINPRCEPWVHASRGSAVDFAAPGEAVWRATTQPPAQERGNLTYVVGMGNGTTFATGTTSGIAALWVVRHRGTQAFEQLKADGEIANAFRDSVARTAWRPGDASRPAPSGVTCTSNDWKPKSYGAGIINAQALIDLPLPASRSRSLESDVLPLFVSLYESPDTQRAVADYRAVFADAPLAGVVRFETEVMFHYVSSEEVRNALDRMVEAPGVGQGAIDVKVALQTQDLSPSLRTALAAP